MTSAFEPTDPQKTPKVLADLLGSGNAKDAFTPQAVKDAANAGGPPIGNKPGTDTAATPKDPKTDTDPKTDVEPKNGAAEHKEGGKTENENTAADPELQTYTSTEPGFPIGQLIAGLLQAGTSAGTAAAGLAMSVPTTALSTLMPIFQAFLSLLGNPATSTTHRTPAALPGPAPTLGGDKFSGPAAEKYRERSATVDAAEKPFAEQDRATSDAVEQARTTNAEASAVVNKAIGDLHTAAAAAPITGQAAFAAAASQAITTARNAVSAAIGTNQGLTYQLVANRAATSL